MSSPFEEFHTRAVKLCHMQKDVVKIEYLIEFELFFSLIIHVCLVQSLIIIIARLFNSLSLHMVQYLDENKKLILAILDNQNLGKLAECAQ